MVQVMIVEMVKDTDVMVVMVAQVILELVTVMEVMVAHRYIYFIFLDGLLYIKVNRCLRLLSSLIFIISNVL